MGIVLANADLPSYAELRRFKEHATVLLVSGVFILLAASLDLAAVWSLEPRHWLFIAAVILVARPLTVFISLLGSGVPWREQVLVAFTGPRGVVLVAVAGLFGDRLVGLGITDGAQIAPLAFVLVAATVLLHGFTLSPFARMLGLTGGDVPGVIVVGASPWGAALAEALFKAKVPVLMADPNAGRLWRSRVEGVATFTGDILSEAAEENIELVSFGTIAAVTDNDAYNTLVATDLGPEFGRNEVWQVAREKGQSLRYQLPSSLGGQRLAGSRPLSELNALVRDGWFFGTTRLTEEFSYSDWREMRPKAILIATIGKGGALAFVADEAKMKPEAGQRLLSMLPPEAAAAEAPAEAPDEGKAAAAR
jgi:hypothetical protein